jgi:hypothetical protein
MHERRSEGDSGAIREEVLWWRRGELCYCKLLIIDSLLILRCVKYAKNGLFADSIHVKFTCLAKCALWMNAERFGASSVNSTRGFISSTERMPSRLIPPSL